MNILLAEDDLHIRQGLTDMLSNEGYTITAAENGQIALELFHQQSFDFVILDIMMPVLDGFSVCKNIRQHNEHIPILFLTAKSEEIDKVLGLELGADDYVNKPFSLAELRARIKAIARRCLTQQNPTAEQQSFQLADLHISPTALSATHTRHDTPQSIELSLREIRILQCFKQHANQVVSRDKLFDYAWGYDYLPNSRTLDQHISKLRKLIEIDKDNPTIIQTVHGQGYRYRQSQHSG